MRSRKLKAAFIGCGAIANAHIEAFKRYKDLSLHSVFDVDPSKAERFVSEFGAKLRRSYEEILEDPAVDAVYILTPNGLHAQQAIAAAKAKKHIFCEKPFAITVEQADEVVKAVDDAGVKFAVGYKMRHFPTVLAVKQRMPEPLMIIGQVMDKPWPDTHWATLPEHGGGSLVDQAGHVIDGVCFLAGARPLTVHAVGANYYQKNGVVDNCIATIHFDNGVAGCVIMGDAWTPHHASKFSMSAYAKGISIELYNRFNDTAISEDGKEPQVIVYEGNSNLEAFLLENRIFIDSIRNDKQPPQNHHHGRHITKILAYAMKSCQDGKVYPLS